MVDLNLLNIGPGLRTQFASSTRPESLLELYEFGRQLTDSLVASSQKLGVLEAVSSSRGSNSDLQATRNRGNVEGIRCWNC
jgi:hypothetical protein